MKNTKLILTLALAGTMLPMMFPMRARAATPAVDPDPQSAVTNAQEEAWYNNGSKAMDEQRWSDAVTYFDQVAAAKGKRADAALYWKAYSLQKLGRKDEAMSTCDSLKQQMSSSPWNKECVVLRVGGSAADARAVAEKVRQEQQEQRDQIRVISREQVYKRTGQETSEDDIKVLALNALLQQEPAKALPILHDLILSDKPIELRKQALFVLSRSHDPQAQAMLLDIATSAKDPSLQEIAVQALAIYHPKDSGVTLVKIYQSTTDMKVKRSVVNGLFISKDATRLVELARGEKDLNMKRDIVSQLAIMHDPVATAYMEELLK